MTEGIHVGWLRETLRYIEVKKECTVNRGNRQLFETLAYTMMYEK